MKSRTFYVYRPKLWRHSTTIIVAAVAAEQFSSVLSRCNFLHPQFYVPNKKGISLIIYTSSHNFHAMLGMEFFSEAQIGKRDLGQFSSSTFVVKWRRIWEGEFWPQSGSRRCPFSSLNSSPNQSSHQTTSTVPYWRKYFAHLIDIGRIFCAFFNFYIEHKFSNLFRLLGWLPGVGIIPNKSIQRSA